MFAFLTLGAGLALLAMGGEFLVRGSARLAARYGVSPLVIGLTVVAFGTSAPELAVSLQSVRAGAADLAVGNVVGSLIFDATGHERLPHFRDAMMFFAIPLTAITLVVLMTRTLVSNAQAES